MPIIPIGRTLAVHVVFALFVFVFSLFFIFCTVCCSVFLFMSFSNDFVTMGETASVRNEIEKEMFTKIWIIK